MKIALLISGRAARYEVCLLPFLLNNSKNYDFHLFMSINDKNSDCLYYNEMKKELSKWLRKVEIKEYLIPEEIVNIFKPSNKVSLQKINNKWLPYNCLSMYYNDNRSFNMAVEYEKENNIKFDFYMKFRSDIINFTLPHPIPFKKNHLHSCVPLCHFQTKGIHKIMCISDAIAWGCRETMELYTNCYQFALKKIIEKEGDYYIAFEDTITDNVIENNINYSFHKLDYQLDVNRRIFDKTWEGKVGERNDSRQHNIRRAKNPIDIISVKDTKHIRVIPHE